MRIMRWVFLSLYALLVLVLLVAAAIDDFDALVVFSIVFGIMVSCQAIFIFGSGTMRLCRPMRKRRLIFPVVVASFMMALLLFALLMATWELSYTFGDEEWVFWVIVALSLFGWLAWGWVFWHRYRDRHRHTAMSRLTAWVLAGSLLELIACVPMHLIVSRRPGCLVGLMTMLGIIAGCLVACFAFGPAIVLLFLRPRHREELAAAARGERYCDVCGYDLRASFERCPECGTPFTLPG